MRLTLRSKFYPPPHIHKKYPVLHASLLPFFHYIQDFLKSHPPSENTIFNYS